MSAYRGLTPQTKKYAATRTPGQGASRRGALSSRFRVALMTVNAGLDVNSYRYFPAAVAISSALSTFVIPLSASRLFPGQHALGSRQKPGGESCAAFLWR